MGLPVVAVTSLDHSRATASRHAVRAGSSPRSPTSSSTTPAWPAMPPSPIEGLAHSGRAHLVGRRHRGRQHAQDANRRAAGRAGRAAGRPDQPAFRRQQTSRRRAARAGLRGVFPPRHSRLRPGRRARRARDATNEDMRGGSAVVGGFLVPGRRHPRSAVRAGRCTRSSSRPGPRRTVATLVEAIRGEGGEADYLAADLTEDGAADRAVADAAERFGRIDAVFNVAGGSGRRFGDGPTHLATAEGWDATLRLNLRSQFLMCRAAPNRDARAGAGRAGPARRDPQHDEHPCVPSFAGPLPHARLRRGEGRNRLAHHDDGGVLRARQTIRVNAVAPSLTRTPMAGRAASDPDDGGFRRVEAAARRRAARARGRRRRRGVPALQRSAGDHGPGAEGGWRFLGFRSCPRRLAR